MPAYRLTPDARSDLIKIQQFTIEQWGVAQSREYLAELRVTTQLLAETPALGKGWPDVGPDVFSFPQGSHENGQQITVTGFQRFLPPACSRIFFAQWPGIFRPF